MISRGYLEDIHVSLGYANPCIKTKTFGFKPMNPIQILDIICQYNILYACEESSDSRQNVTEYEESLKNLKDPLDPVAGVWRVGHTP